MRLVRLKSTLPPAPMGELTEPTVHSAHTSPRAAAPGVAIAFVVTSLVRHAGTFDGSQAPSRATQVLRLPFGKLSAGIQIDFGPSFRVGHTGISLPDFG
jgi:hypothetical protein